MREEQSDLVGCLAADCVAVVVAGDSHVDVGGGEVGPVLLQHRLVPDGPAGTLQERRGISDLATAPQLCHFRSTPLYLP